MMVARSEKWKLIELEGSFLARVNRNPLRIAILTVLLRCTSLINLLN